MAFSTLVAALVQSKAWAGAAMRRRAARLAAIFMGFFFPKGLIGGETFNAGGGYRFRVERDARELLVVHEGEAGGAGGPGPPAAHRRAPPDLRQMFRGGRGEPA